jgi:hypothetical protein
MTKLRLVADNVRSFEWESYPRREPKAPRERLGPIRPVRPNRKLASDRETEGAAEME